MWLMDRGRLGYVALVQYAATLLDSEALNTTKANRSERCVQASMLGCVRSCRNNLDQPSHGTVFNFKGLEVVLECEREGLALRGEAGCLLDFVRLLCNGDDARSLQYLLRGGRAYKLQLGPSLWLRTVLRCCASIHTHPPTGFTWVLAIPHASAAA